METNKLNVLRLKSGEDIIAVVTNVIGTPGGNLITIREPLRLLYMMANAGGTITVALIEWIFPRVSDVKEVTLNSSDILFIIPPTDSLIQYYNEYISKPNESDVTNLIETIEDNQEIMEKITRTKREKLN